MRLHELRRNPEHNVKKNGHAAALEFLSTIPSSQMKNYGVTMASINKVGIRPSPLNTNISGVYYYPASYYKKLKTRGTTIPHDDMPFINILKLSGKKIDVSKITIPAVEDVMADMGFEYDGSMITASQCYSFARAAIEQHSFSRQSMKTPNATLNAIFRQFGDILVDNGGNISANIPVMGICLIPSAYTVVAQFDNRVEATSDEIAFMRELSSIPISNYLTFICGVEPWNKVPTKMGKSAISKINQSSVQYPEQFQNIAVLNTVLGGRFKALENVDRKTVNDLHFNVLSDLKKYVRQGGQIDPRISPARLNLLLQDAATKLGRGWR